MTSITISQEIQSILDKDKLEDLKQFISRRKCLNSWNIGLVYLFHFIQTDERTALLPNCREFDVRVQYARVPA